MSETRTLKQLLDALQPAGSHLSASGWINIPELAESIIRRCAEVARFTDDGPIADACADAILREAGLGGEERDGD